MAEFSRRPRYVQQSSIISSRYNRRSKWS